MKKNDVSDGCRSLETNASGPIGSSGIGRPEAGEQRALKWSGMLLGLSDLLWIPQAGLLALALGGLLASFASDGIAAGTSGQLPVSLVISAAGLIVLALLRSWLQMRALTGARRVARRIQSRTRADILAAVVRRSPAAGFPASGVFAAQLTEQVEMLGPYYRNYVPQLVRLKLVPVGILLAALTVSWLAALILLVCGPIIPVFMALIGIRAKAASAGQQEELTRLSGMLLDRIRGLETLVLFGAADRTKEDIREAGETFRLGTMRVLKIAFLSSTVLELFSALGIAFCAVYVGFSLLGDVTAGTWSGPLTYSGGLFVLLLAPEFFAPLRAYSAAYHDRAGGVAAQEKLTALIQDIGGLEPRPDTFGAEDMPAQGRLPAPPSIRFEDVSLELGGRRIYSNFDFEIDPGETVLLKGASGSGKTTLIDCVLGFHTPDKGEVLLDGRNVLTQVENLRRHVVWLGQAPRLFHGSLKANLLKGNADRNAVSEEELWAALELAGAAELVRRLPNGLSTPVGEDGFGLSVGEIRRIALARAALRRNAVLLLADEPTAGLDEETAGDVIAGLEHLAHGRTALIASHNPALLSKLPGRQVDLSTCREVARKAVNA
ncbi:thiol reductant ABC exporter subunit CydD [Roseibium sp.]|uniref:thiol reductant ABC exporter subunit CydD n=1 Tax=Roseibium sp. TaxID=1936156 RepID=UPI003D117428